MFLNLFHFIQKLHLLISLRENYLDVIRVISHWTEDYTVAAESLHYRHSQIPRPISACALVIVTIKMLPNNCTDASHDIKLLSAMWAVWRYFRISNERKKVKTPPRRADPLDATVSHWAETGSGIHAHCQRHCWTGCIINGGIQCEWWGHLPGRGSLISDGKELH